MRLVKPACAISEGNSRTRENLSKCHYFLQHFFFVCQQRFISKTFEFPILFSKSFHVIQDNTFYVTFKNLLTFVDNAKRLLERGFRVRVECKENVILIQMRHMDECLNRSIAYIDS